jgi:parvulin-like peptidyl-prolyl isomerase
MIPFLFLLSINPEIDKPFDCIVATVGTEAITENELKDAEKIYGEKALHTLIEEALMRQEERRVQKSREELLRTLFSSVWLTEEEIERVKEQIRYQIHLLHILVSEREEAERVMEKIKRGEDFLKVAEEHSICAPDLGYVTRGALRRELEEVAFLLKEGEVSEVICTELGYHILKCVKKRVTPNQKFQILLNAATSLVLEKKINEAKKKWLQTLRKRYGVKVWESQKLQ